MDAPFQLSTLPLPLASAERGRIRVLVALASYGTSNNRHLERWIRAYRSMAFDVDIVILSNTETRAAPSTECRVGPPRQDPWSLPFAARAGSPAPSTTW